MTRYFNLIREMEVVKGDGEITTVEVLYLPTVHSKDTCRCFLRCVQDPYLTLVKLKRQEDASTRKLAVSLWELRHGVCYCIVSLGSKAAAMSSTKPLSSTVMIEAPTWMLRIRISSDT